MSPRNSRCASVVRAACQGAALAKTGLLPVNHGRDAVVHSRTEASDNAHATPHLTHWVSISDFTTSLLVVASGECHGRYWLFWDGSFSSG